jgi:two-component system, chemotaxis family, CheB/CheR fusion protein
MESTALLPEYADFVIKNYFEDFLEGCIKQLMVVYPEMCENTQVPSKIREHYFYEQAKELLIGISEEKNFSELKENAPLFQSIHCNYHVVDFKNLLDVFQTQKTALKKYIFFYTSVLDKGLQLIEEIDGYYTFVYSLSLQNYLISEKLIQKNPNYSKKDELKKQLADQDYTVSLLTRITDNVQALIAYTGVDLRYIFVNRQYEEWFGIDREQIVGAKVEDIVGKAAFEKVLPYIKKVLTGYEQQYEAVLPYKYGGTRVVSVNMVPTYKGGEVAGYFVLISDISEKFASGKALAESEQKLKTLAESMPMMVWARDAEWNLEYVNQRWLDYSGQNFEQTKENCFYILHPDDISAAKKIISEKRERGEPYSIEIRFRRASDGAYLWHLLNVIPLKDESGKIVQWIGTAANIHPQKLNEIKKDEFIGIAGHEFKTPLTSLKAYAELLSQEELNAVPEKYVNAIKTQINRLEKLVSNLLDVTKLNSESVTLSKETIYWDSILESAIETIKSTSPKYNFIYPELPSIKMTGDRERLMQVIVNLLSNAVKYSNEGSKVEIKVFVEKGKVKTYIKDQGVGIDENELESVFTKFYRAQNPMSNKQGLGVGLYIAKQLVQLHGGDITVKSKSGVGSEFCLALPAEIIN